MWCKVMWNKWEFSSHNVDTPDTSGCRSLWILRSVPITAMNYLLLLHWDFSACMCACVCLTSCGGVALLSDTVVNGLGVGIEEMFAAFCACVVTGPLHPLKKGKKEDEAFAETHLILFYLFASPFALPTNK